MYKVHKYILLKELDLLIIGTTISIFILKMKLVLHYSGATFVLFLI